MHQPQPSRVLSLMLLLLIMVSCVPPRAVHAAEVASYRVRMSEGSLRLLVSARLPIAGSSLRMDDTRPAGIPELDSLGWAGLVTNMRVTGPDGRARQVTRNGAEGWTLSQPDTALLDLEYEIDLGPLERLSWPAPREAAYRESDKLMVVGRALFVTTAASHACRVVFDLPKGWRAVTPWSQQAGPQSFLADAPQDLTENLIVLTRGAHDELVSGNFHLFVFSCGRWDSVRTDMRGMLRSVVRHHVAMMADHAKRSYVVVLLPERTTGGESYRASFAINTDVALERANVPVWGNLIAHEVFHLWNGWTLRGADYTSTQWFQEGFTEYVANLTSATAGVADADWLRTKLATHLERSRRLTTTLEDIGTHKGPPLYSTGALVAFTWDVRIREATGGRKDIGDFFRELMRQTDNGRRAYAWSDLRAALEATAPGDWEGYYQAYIHGEQPPPVEHALNSLGLRSAEQDGHVRVEPDPRAGEGERDRWGKMTRRR